MTTVRPYLNKLHEKDFIEIFLDQQNNWLYANWKGYQSDASVVEGCGLILAELKDLQVDRVLNDNREVLGIWTGVANWLAREWFPQLRNAGMRKFALIYSPSRLAQISADAAILPYDPEGNSVAAFASEELACEWLAAAQQLT